MSNILDVKPGVQTVIIGTVYKEMQKKPAASDDLVKRFVQSLADGTAKWNIEKFKANYELTDVQIKLIEAV